MSDWNVQLERLPERYQRVRNRTEALCEPLEAEDYVVQSMPEASPAKWHLAHTTWFFERFILEQLLDHAPVDERYNFIFNSYYNTAGDQHRRAERGLLSRPTVEEIYTYRSRVDEHMRELLDSERSNRLEVARRIDVGLHHEQQHQELLLTDIKHMFAQNPYPPDAFGELAPDERTRDEIPALEWAKFSGGLHEIGYDGDAFAYDNERPNHEVRLYPFEVATRPITCGEYIEFIEDGGYDRVQLWLSDGWQRAEDEGWESPLYWRRKEGAWHLYTLSGLRPVDPDEPVTHVSYYEARAFAEWSGHRLPTEDEWEVVSKSEPLDGHFVDSGRLHPAPVSDTTADRSIHQLFGDVWEWTSSAYEPYPGFESFESPLGEYNGKFMCNQQVLRGGSCATSESHIRRTYRNFFYPDARWQFSGIRLARDA